MLRLCRSTHRENRLQCQPSSPKPSNKSPAIGDLPNRKREIPGTHENEISQSQNIKTTLTKKNVLESISKLLGQLKKITKIPENGLVMFSGAIAQNGIPGTEKNEIYIIDPP